jgi:hypothetical protein
VRFQWVKNILLSTGADFSEIFIDSEEEQTYDNMSIIQKAKLRKVLDQNNITISDNHDGSLLVFIDHDIIAEWGVPNFKLHFDGKEPNQQKRWYIEVEIDCWSVFDDEEQNG